MRGNQVVIPKQLRQQAVDLAHQGHQGLIKTKQLIREKIWFPGIDNLVKTSIEKCLACQSVGMPKNPAPLCTIEIPKNPWDTIYVDFLGPFPNSVLLLVIIDGRTRYPEVDIVRSTTAESTIRAFEKVFVRHGLPNTIITDNGPPFTSYELKS